jgi:hypothetical protein
MAMNPPIDPGTAMPPWGDTERVTVACRLYLPGPVSVNLTLLMSPSSGSSVCHGLWSGFS